jgi:hypothetical protein
MHHNANRKPQRMIHNERKHNDRLMMFGQSVTYVNTREVYSPVLFVRACKRCCRRNCRQLQGSCRGAAGSFVDVSYSTETMQRIRGHSVLHHNKRKDMTKIKNT